MKQEWMTIRDVANELGGMSTDFVQREITSGRLVAAVNIKRPSGRTHRKISRADFEQYREVYCRPSMHN